MNPMSLITILIIFAGLGLLGKSLFKNANKSADVVADRVEGVAHGVIDELPAATAAATKAATGAALGTFKREFTPSKFDKLRNNIEKEIRKFDEIMNIKDDSGVKNLHLKCPDQNKACFERFRDEYKSKIDEFCTDPKNKEACMSLVDDPENFKVLEKFYKRDDKAKIDAERMLEMVENMNQKEQQDIIKATRAERDRRIQAAINAPQPEMEVDDDTLAALEAARIAQDMSQFKKPKKKGTLKSIFSKGKKRTRRKPKKNKGRRKSKK